MEFLLIIFIVMVAFSSLKIVIKLFWAIMSPLASLGAVVFVLYLFSLLVGK